MPVSVIRSSYLLLEAFHLLGRRLFAHEWSRFELDQMDVRDPDVADAEHAPYAEKVRQLDEELAAIDEEKRSEIKDAKVAKLKKRREFVMEARYEAINEQMLHLGATNTHRETYAANIRKRTTIDTLVAALADKKIAAFEPDSIVVPHSLWSEENRFFGFDIRLSLVRMPKDRYRRRILLALIDDGEFDAWLQTVVPLVASEEQNLSPEARCEFLLRKMARDHTPGQPPPLKPAVFDLIKLDCPELSRRLFDRTWARATPEFWRSRGRRRGS